jgi:multiple antibiotic resistance protein
MDELTATFIFFFAVIDPIGTVPVFIAVTKGIFRTLNSNPSSE